MGLSYTEMGIPQHQELVIPVLRAISELGGSAKSAEIVEQVLDSFPNAEELMSITYEKNSQVPVLRHRVEFGRSLGKRIGCLEQPGRGVYLLTDYGEELLALPENEALVKIREADAKANLEYRRKRAEAEQQTTSFQDKDTDSEVDDISLEDEIADDEESSTRDWKLQLLNRLHTLSPDGFEKFVIYLLKRYGLRLSQTAPGADEGIDAIGMAPLSPVLSSRVAVQVKRYDPAGSPIGRETVALFQRDAQTKGAERAILVTLSRFTESARKAATMATPTVDLIDGDRLSELVLADEESGVSMQPTVDENWYNRFE